MNIGPTLSFPSLQPSHAGPPLPRTRVGCVWEKPLAMTNCLSTEGPNGRGRNTQSIPFSVSGCRARFVPRPNINPRPYVASLAPRGGGVE